MATLSPYKVHTAKVASGALASTLAPGVTFVVAQIKLHINTAVVATEDFTVTEDAAEGVEFDTRILTQAMNGKTDVLQAYEHPGLVFKLGDELDFAFPNADNNAVGLKVIYREEV